MKNIIIMICIFVTSIIFISCSVTNSNESRRIRIINVSYDTTREFYEDYNNLFKDYYFDKTGINVDIVQSHGASAKQARTVIEGLKCDVVTLARSLDVDMISRSGLIDKGWKEKNNYNSSPYTSAVVFVVRNDNEKNINDWDDIIKSNVNVVTPNPKLSGGATWNFLAAYAYFDKKLSHNEEEIINCMKDMYKNVSFLSSGARESATSFAEYGEGDVLIAWENEAYLIMKKYPNKFKIVNPSVSIKCEMADALVDENVDEKGTRTLGEDYLSYLYSSEAQEIAVAHYLRPSNQKILEKHSDIFNLDMDLVDIDYFGGWDSANEKFFKSDGIFDKIYGM